MGAHQDVRGVKRTFQELLLCFMDVHSSSACLKSNGAACQGYCAIFGILRMNAMDAVAVVTGDDNDEGDDDDDDDDAMTTMMMTKAMTTMATMS